VSVPVWEARGDVAVGDAADDPDGAVLLTAAELLAQLADPTRLQLVRLLGTEEQDVTTLTGQVSASRSSVSQHLGRLRLAGLVAARRDGWPTRPSTSQSILSRLSPVITTSHPCEVANHLP
jgi:predicted transcriptional regulator